MYTYQHNKNYFEKINTSEKAYWLGFLYADGSLYRRDYNRGWEGYYFELSLKESDKDHLIKFKKTIECNVPLKKKSVTLEKYGTFYSYRLQFFCKKFAKDLIKSGCIERKSLKLEYPNQEVLSKDFYPDFIRGYFDGDGCIYYGYKPSNQQVACSFSLVGTSKFLDSISNVFHQNLDIEIPKQYKCGNNKQIFWYGFKKCKIIYSYLYYSECVFLNSKKKVFDRVFAHKRGDTFVEADKNGER